MKRYLFTILAAGLAFTSCAKFVQDPKIEFAEIEAPAVTATTTSDTEINIGITPEDGTVYYSYVVVAGPVRELDPETVLKCKYSSIAISVTDEGEDGKEIVKKVYGIVNASETESLSLNLAGLDPNTNYTVYAVASNAQGVISEVASASTLTTDSTAPKFLKATAVEDAGKMTFEILFDDPVVTTGEGKVTAKFYALNTEVDENGLFSVQKSVELPVENVSSSNGLLYIEIPVEEYVPGACVGLDWTADIATNALGAKIPAKTSLVGVHDGGLATSGAVSQYKNVSFDLSLTEVDEDDSMGSEDTEEEVREPVKFSDWEGLQMVVYARTELPLEGYGRNAAVTVVTTEPTGRKITYATDNHDIVAADNTAFVGLEEEPAFGSLVSFYIAEDSIFDIYGNSNNAFEAEDAYFYSYGYKLDDVIGTYTFNSRSPYESYGYGPYANVLTISASDDEEEGNIKFAGELSDIAVEFYGYFDTDAGTIILPQTPVVGTCIDYVYGEDGKPLVGEDGNKVTYTFDAVLALSDGESIYSDQIGFDVPSPHTLNFWFAGQIFIGIIEMYQGSPYSIYDLLNLQSIEYTTEATASANRKALRRSAPRKSISSIRSL